MPKARVAVATLATLLAGVLTACGDSSSSSTTSASKADFCRTFDQLGSETSPRHAADELTRVGTPSDMSAGARHGFDVLVDHLRDLPEGTQPRQITQMVQGLDDQDMSDVRAFITYYGKECQGVPGDSSS
jgi:hypothetical protein